MSPKPSHLGWAFIFSMIAMGNGMAQPVAPQPVKPTGPAAKKAEELIQAYTARIEKEIDQGRNEVARLRAELHELIDVRYAMADAIAELRGEMATKGTYSGAQFVAKPASPKPPPAPPSDMQPHRDFVYGLGMPCPKSRPRSNASSSAAWLLGPT